MQIHPAAELFPMLDGAEYEALKADIASHGQQQPITTYQGSILDGRNRYRACTELGVAPHSKEYEGDDPLRYVISLNLHRRHLNESQRAMVAARLATLNQGRPPEQDKPANLPVSQFEAAGLLNVSERTVRAAAKVRDEAAPEVVAAVEKGDLSVSDAAAIADMPKPDQAEILEQVKAGKVRTAKAARRRKEVSDQRRAIESGEVSLPEGLYEVISLDPPWPYDDGNTEADYNEHGHRASNWYPEMSLEEIGALKLPAAPDCTLWLWTTHKFMRHAFPLLDAWGFEERSIVTWVKDRMGLGRWLRSQSEFCIMATRGRPVLTLTNQTTILHGPMREHSRKPDEFYVMVESLCAGRKLDYFSREARPGWDQYGNDPEKFAA